MKNLKATFVFLGLTILVGIHSIHGQFTELQFPEDQVGSIPLYGYTPPINLIAAESPNSEFNFNLYYNNISVLLELDAARRKANRAEFDRWLKNQENNFKNEINSQLGTNYSNFKDAQKEFFKNFEKNYRALDDRVAKVASSHSNLSKTLDQEQENNTLQLIALENFRNPGNSTLGEVIINGKKIIDVANLNNSNFELNVLKLSATEQFSTKEYQSALNKNWSSGVISLLNNQPLLDGFIKNHTDYYNSKSLQDKVFLMTAYLTQYKNRYSGPIAIPLSQYIIPTFWDNNKLLDLGKQKAPALKIEALVFDPVWFKNNTGSNQQNLNYYNDIKAKIIEEHQSLLANYGVNLGNVLYGSQWTRVKDASWLKRRDNIYIVEIQKTLAFLEKNKNSVESINAAKEISKIMNGGTSLEKKFAKAFISNDFNTVFDILFQGAEYSALFPCPNPPCDELLEPISGLTAKIIVDFIDAIPNLLIFMTEPHLSDEDKGKLIRLLASDINKVVPSDVDNKTLGRLFKVRRRGLVYELDYANEDFRSSLLDVGMTSLDLFGLISPGSGTTRYLFIKSGGSITTATISSYLKQIAVNAKKIDGLINSLKANARYYLDGTGIYRVVGGHHPLAKIAFESDNFYKLKEAFSVGTATLEKFGGKGVHNIITGQQNSLYSTFAKTGNRLTIEKMAEIEIQALVNSGIPRDIAQGWVIKALEDLKSQGVKVITNIPWNGLN
tara:strand:- start:33843 stop:36017 length:2175 start_codon:yes stop_codon:yes gene_type:complete